MAGQSFADQLREGYRQVAGSLSEDERVLVKRARDPRSAGAAERNRLLAEVVCAYRSGPKTVWGPAVLDLLAPTLVLILQRLRPIPHAIDESEIRQQLIAEALQAAVADRLLGGGGRGSAGPIGVRGIPQDPRGIVLACGLVGLAALAIATVIAGDWLGFAYMVAAGLGYLYLQTRLVPTTVWLAVGAVSVLSATGGNPEAWIVVGLAGLLAIVALVPPPEEKGRETSRNPEVGAG